MVLHIDLDINESSTATGDASERMIAGQAAQDRNGAAAEPGHGTIVVRGDLFSDSGYGRATRALSTLLAGRARRLFGVSLHEHAARRTNAFPFIVITDETLVSDRRLSGCCVVNICLPSMFFMVPSAHNIGYFFWESEQFPPQAFWKAKLRLMDELWAPSRWQAAVLERETGRRDVAVVPWPQGIDRPPCAPRETLLGLKAHRPQGRDQLANYLLRISSDLARHAEQAYEQIEHEAGRGCRFDPGASPSLAHVLDSEGDTFLAVQTDAPRKGLHLLMSAWRQFRRTSEGRKAKLVVKMSSIDVSVDLYRLHFHMSLAVRRPMQRLAVADSGVYFVYDRLSDGAMRALVARCDAFVSATMGEGFGGPLAEAFEEGKPVIAPDHTSCRDILGADYPLAVAHLPQRHKLWNNLDVYSPSSVWNIVDDVSLLDRLVQFSRTPLEERQAIAEAARARLDAAVGAGAVGTVLAERLRRHL